MKTKLGAQVGYQVRRRYKARLSLFHVVKHFPEDMPVNEIGPEDVDAKEFLRIQAQRRRADLVKHLQVEQVEQKVVLSPHSARHEILQAAQQWRVGLIVVGSHSGRGVTELSGSTALDVIHNAPCNALAVRGQQ